MGYCILPNPSSFIHKDLLHRRPQAPPNTCSTCIALVRSVRTIHKMNLSRIHVPSRILRSLQSHVRLQQRSFAIKTPGSDPLELLKHSSEKRGFCDVDGIRKKDVHWTFCISTSGASAHLVSTGCMVVDGYILTIYCSFIHFVYRYSLHLYALLTFNVSHHQVSNSFESEVMDCPT
jgi:hypothetical protein